MDPERAKGRIGATLKGRYRLDAVIGVGGMAVVYRGAHRNGNRVAVKILHPELSIIDDLRNRFLKEGYVANAVDHPGAVRVLDDDITEDGQVFLVMDLLDGDTLEQLWRKSPDKRLLARDVVEYAAQILATLGAAHRQGIVHRDIKPENLFLTRERQVKVLDFGIARVRAANAESLTRTGRMLGTPAYMPPEQALGLTKEIDGRTDLWALGASMFSLLTGAFVHPAETTESMLVFTATRPARSLAGVAPEVPTLITQVIDRALAFKKEDRHPDAAAMMSALADAYRAAYGVPLPGVVQAPPRIDDKATVPMVNGPTVPVSVSALLDALPDPPRAMIAPAMVSTTAGVSSEPRRSPPQVAPPALAPPPPAASASTTRPARPPVVIVTLALALACLLALSVGLLVRTIRIRGRAPDPLPSASSLAELPPAPSASASAPVSSAEAASTPAIDAGLTVAAPSASAAVVPARPIVRPPARPRPAELDCSPPFFIDQAGNKKVKTGC